MQSKLLCQKNGIMNCIRLIYKARCSLMMPFNRNGFPLYESLEQVLQRDSVNLKL